MTEDKNVHRLAVDYFRRQSAGDGMFWDFVPEALLDSPLSMIETFFEFVHFSGAAITFGGNQPCYDLRGHRIYMPKRGFCSDTRYCEILAHELIHWTRPELNRHGLTYAMEEFVAQYGGNLLLSAHGFSVSELQFDYFCGYAANANDAADMLRQAADMGARASDFLMERAMRNRLRHT